MIAKAHSADVRIELVLESGEVLPISQISDGTLILRTFVRGYPECDARLAVDVDGSRKETMIYLTHGISSRRVKYL